MNLADSFKTSDDTPQYTEEDLLSFVDEALTRNRSRVLQHFQQSGHEGDDPELSHHDLHNLLLGCLPKGQALYRREARLFLALVDPRGAGRVAARALEHNVRTALQLRQQVLDEGLAPPAGGAGKVEWTSVRALLAHRLQRAPSSLWAQQAMLRHRQDPEPSQPPSVDPMGVAAVLKEMVPRIQMDDLRWLVLHVYQTKMDQDGLLTLPQLISALKANVVRVTPQPTRRTSRELGAGKETHTAAATRCLRALIETAEGKSVGGPATPPGPELAENVLPRHVPVAVGDPPVERKYAVDPQFASAEPRGSKHESGANADLHPCTSRASVRATLSAAPPSPSNASVRSAGAYAPSVVSSSAVGLELDSFDACMQALSTYTRQHQVRVRQLFQQYAHSHQGPGRVSISALERLVRRLLLKVTPVQLQYVVAMLTVDDSVEMDHNSWKQSLEECLAAIGGLEFSHLQSIRKQVGAHVSAARVAASHVFAAAQKTRPGRVNRQELVHMLRYQLNMPPLELRCVIHRFFEVSDNNGQDMSWAEFEEFMHLNHGRNRQSDSKFEDAAPSVARANGDKGEASQPEGRGSSNGHGTSVSLTLEGGPEMGGNEAVYQPAQKLLKELRDPVWVRVQEAVSEELWLAVRQKLRAYLP